MSKIAVIGDMHLGIKAGNQYFLDFMFWWLEEALKKMQAQGVNTIIQTGDFFDTRAYIKLNVLHKVIHDFKPLLLKYGIKMWYTYAGNHDLFLRDSNEICSTDILELLWTDDDIQFVVTKNHTMMIETAEPDFSKIVLVPWINKNNEDHLLNGIPDDTDYVFGHFDMIGMPMVPGGAFCEHGMEIKRFKKYKRVISGHFHTISSHLNCTMVGTPYHLNWGDTMDGNNRGFWVLDTDTDEFTLNKNDDHMTLFSVLEYDPKETYDEKFLAPYEGTLVKVIIKEKPEAKHYKKFLELLSKTKLIDYKIIDTTMVEIENVSISEEVLQLDTLTAMEAFIDGQKDDAFNKDSVKKLAKEIYLEALGGGK